MMELRPEYEIVEKEMLDIWHSGRISSTGCISEAVVRCQELADRPRRQLTAFERIQLWESVATVGDLSVFDIVGRICAAYDAKQREPDTVPFDFAKWNAGGWVAVDHAGDDAIAILPGITYTMRRK